MVPVDPGSFGHATKFNSLTDSFLTRHIYRSFDNTLRSVFPGNVGLLIYIGNTVTRIFVLLPVPNKVKKKQYTVHKWLTLHFPPPFLCFHHFLFRICNWPPS